VSKITNYKEDIEVEITELHEFFQNWFTGTVPETAFSRFSNVMNENFKIISPRGDLTNRADLIKLLKNGYRRNPNISISVSDISVEMLSENTFLAIYEEHQKSNNEFTSRISSALFTPNTNSPNNYNWLHVHETWK
jgi:hypothetical protein